MIRKIYFILNTWEFTLILFKDKFCGSISVNWPVLEAVLVCVHVQNSRRLLWVFLLIM